MGTDAKIFVKEKKTYLYIDRSYNIPDEELEPFIYEGSTTKLRASGVSVVSLYAFLDGVANNAFEIYGHQPNQYVVQLILNWLKALSHDDTVFVRDEHNDEYFNLCSEDGGEYEESKWSQD